MLRPYQHRNRMDQKAEHPDCDRNAASCAAVFHSCSFQKTQKLRRITMVQNENCDQKQDPHSDFQTVKCLFGEPVLQPVPKQPSTEHTDRTADYPDPKDRIIVLRKKAASGNRGSSK